MSRGEKVKQFQNHSLYSSDPLTQLYSVTYMYYSFIGCLVTVLVGIMVSFLTGFNENDVYDEKLIHPIARKVASWFPGRKRRYADKILPEDERNDRHSVAKTPQTPVISTIQREDEKTFAKPHIHSSDGTYSQDVPLENIEDCKTRL